MTKRGDKTPKAMGYFMGGEMFKNQLHVHYVSPNCVKITEI